MSTRRVGRAVQVGLLIHNKLEGVVGQRRRRFVRCLNVKKQRKLKAKKNLKHSMLTRLTFVFSSMVSRKLSLPPLVALARLES